MLVREGVLYMKDLSIIMTAYNCENTIYHATKSILQETYKDNIELLIIDDCSQDKTYEIVTRLSEEYENLRVYKTEKNTGSPSIPRNIGMAHAKGKYVAFLDDDDYLDIDVLMSKLGVMDENQLDLLLSNIYIVKPHKQTLGNQVDPNLFSQDKTYAERVSHVFKYVSTTVDCIIRNDFLKTHDHIIFSGDYKIGEDTLFYAEMFSAKPVFAYIKTPHYYYNKGNNSLTHRSTTQQYADFELKQHIAVWEKTEKILGKIAVSYVRHRLPTAFRISLVSLVKYSNGNISKEMFGSFARFTKKYENCLGAKCALSSRYQEIYNTLIKKDYDGFVSSIRKRILINGYDLKFILPLVPYLEKTYHVKVDEWTGHNMHDEQKSQELLQWADIIFCEWLLGNAVWYSKHKSSYQTLLIRAHRFEVERDFGHDIDYSQVDSVITVGYFYFNLFKDTFNIPQKCMRLLSNYVDSSIYTKKKRGDYLNHIAICGILPSRKGFYQGLELIEKLRHRDSKYKLYVIGDNSKNIGWIQNSPAEKAYYQRCSEYIENHNLSENVVFTGRLSRDTMFLDVGFVLSLSDDTDRPESFHLTPAEGAMDGCISLIKQWRGAEYIYDSTFLCNTVDEICEEIVNLSTHKDLFYTRQSKQRAYIKDNYDIALFLERLNDIIDLAVLNS